MIKPSFRKRQSVDGDAASLAGQMRESPAGANRRLELVIKEPSVLLMPEAVL